jgi:formylmethanofuran dehydrogenase subunit E
MLDLQALLAESAALHNHLCPRQVLGVRMGMYAAELLGLELPQADKRLYTFVETDGCFADGIAVATGCWLGHRTLRLMDFGKVASTFFDTKVGRAIRIWPHPAARQRAAIYKPEARSRWHGQLEAYQVMPNAELLCVKEVTLTLSMDALISKPGVRTVCELCGEEIVNEREILANGKVLCRSCAGEGYFMDKPNCIFESAPTDVVIHTVFS